MKHFRLFPLVTSLLAAATATFAAAASMLNTAVDHFVAAVMEMASASPQMVYSSGFSIDSLRPGAPLDPALQNDLRHEAGVSRRSAARSV